MSLTRTQSLPLGCNYHAPLSIVQADLHANYETKPASELLFCKLVVRQLDSQVYETTELQVTRDNKSKESLK